MTIQTEQDNSKLDIRKNILKRFIQVTIQMVLIIVLLLVSAGKIDWIYAWLYIASSLLVIIVNAFILPPEVISVRGQKKENIDKWDRFISGLIIFPWLAIYLVSGLDMRFRFSLELAAWIHVIGLVIFVLGNAFVSWAMISNIYFSTAIRIQYDRGHTVSMGGPYRLLRHPGHLGMIIYLLATPLALGSIWAFIPAILTVILFIIRTAFEDITLKNKLKGYKEYAEKVKYRLIPGIW